MSSTHGVPISWRRLMTGGHLRVQGQLPSFRDGQEKPPLPTNVVMTMAEALKSSSAEIDVLVDPLLKDALHQAAVLLQHVFAEPETTLPAEESVAGNGAPNPVPHRHPRPPEEEVVHCMPDRAAGVVGIHATTDWRRRRRRSVQPAIVGQDRQVAGRPSRPRSRWRRHCVRPNPWPRGQAGRRSRARARRGRRRHACRRSS